MCVCVCVCVSVCMCAYACVLKNISRNMTLCK